MAKYAHEIKVLSDIVMILKIHLNEAPIMLPGTQKGTVFLHD